jgi:hypothetical protein
MQVLLPWFEINRLADCGGLKKAVICEMGGAQVRPFGILKNPAFPPSTDCTDPLIPDYWIPWKFVERLSTSKTMFAWPSYAVRHFLLKNFLLTYMNKMAGARACLE